MIRETEYPCGTDRQHTGRIIQRGKCAVCDVLAGIGSTPVTRKLAVMHADLQELGAVLKFKQTASSATLDDIDRATALIKGIIEGVDRTRPS